MLIFFGFDILESNSSNPPVDNNRDKDQRFKSFCQHYKHQWFSFLPGEEKKILQQNEAYCKIWGF